MYNQTSVPVYHTQPTVLWTWDKSAILLHIKKRLTTDFIVIAVKLSLDLSSISWKIY